MRRALVGTGKGAFICTFVLFTGYGKAGIGRMRRRTYRHLMSLIAASTMAFSVLSQGGMALAASAGMEDTIEVPEGGEEPSAEGNGIGGAFSEGAALAGTEGAAQNDEFQKDAISDGVPQEGTEQREQPQEGVEQGEQPQEGTEQGERPQEGTEQGEQPQEEILQGGVSWDGVIQEGVPQEGTVQEGTDLNGALLKSAFAASVPEERASGEVTYETSTDYVHNIYANGQPLLIVASKQAGYAKLYIDANGNGIGDQEEEITYLQGSGTMGEGGIYYDSEAGYFLTNSFVYGGGKDDVCQYDTCVTLAGSSNLEADPTVRIIYGGNANGTLTGDTCVNISGGTAAYVFGGGNQGEINGDTSVHMTGGGVTGGIYGGSVVGQINGNTSVEVEHAQVSYVFGGNEVSGKVTGNTNLVFEEGTLATGWIYGGGAGYSNDVITEVAGSTNIIIHGGEFQRNIYGGGGWRGATVGSSNIIVNGGDISYSSIYGGGEEQSVVTGKASITVNGGNVNSIYASGAGFNGTVAEVGEAEICLKGGKVDWFSALTSEENENVVIKDALSFELSGDTFSDITLNFGLYGRSISLSDLNVTLKNAEVKMCLFRAPVKGSMSLTFDNASATVLEFAGNVLQDAAEATLSYINCGSAEKIWGEQPKLKGSQWNGNKFTTILMKDSYINFEDDSFTTEDNTLRACTEKLIVDGGALRVIGFMTSYMPLTEFRNVPLILRTSDKEAIHFDEIPEGTARVQWMNDDGTVPEDKSSTVIVEGPTETLNKLFVSGYPDYVVKTDSIAKGSSGSGFTWRGKGWYVGTSEQFCTCQLLESSLEKKGFPLAGEEDAQTVVTLRDVQTGSTAYSKNCKVVEHEGTAVAVAYSLISEGTTAPGASLNGDQLAVLGTGSVHVRTTQYLNGKSLAYDSYVQFLEVPDSDTFTFTEGLVEELSLSFGGINAEGIINSAMLWSNTENKIVSKTNYSVTTDENGVKFNIKDEYLDSFAIGEYSFEAYVPYLDGGNSSNKYIYHFTVNIVPVIEVENPVIELSEERFHYDGKAKEPSVVVKDGDTIISEDEYEVSYQDNVDVGIATVIISDKPGGRYTVNGSRTYEIINEYTAENGTDYLAVLNENGWTNEDFIISAKDGYLLSGGNTLTDLWVEALEQTEETADGSVTFYVKNMETGLISLAATENYKIDRTAPEEWDIQFDGSSVKTELENISFTGLFGESIEVKLMAEDALSGIDQISYLSSESILTQEQLENAEEWVGGKEFMVSAEDGKKFIVYGKAVDQAGNTTYFASEGGEFDLKGPEMGGVESGTTYYVTQVVNVTDAHPGTFTLNGEEVFGDVILPGNREAVYVIRAVDSLGNETVVTVTMKPISSLAEPIKELTENNVTSDDAELIRQVLETAESAFGENMSPEEEEELQKVIDTCKALDERIQAVWEEYDRIGNETGSISIESVKLTDQEALEKAEEALEKLLEEYDGNYTEDEKKQMEADLLRVTEALESIRKVRTVEGSIATLPDAEGVSPDDVEAEKAAKQAKDLLESLTEHERSLVDVERLEKLLAALINYRMLEGDGSEWTKGATGEITFKANGSIGKFVGILIDGQSVESEYYTATAGSTIITLKESLMKMLSVGTHSLTILYPDGQTSAMFEILEESNSGEEEKPGTGEEGPGTGEEGPGTGEEGPGTGGEEPGTGEEGPGTGGEEPGTGEERPGTGEEGSRTGEERPGTGEERPGAGEESPGTGGEFGTGEEGPDTGKEGSGTGEERPDGGEEDPGHEEEATDNRDEALDAGHENATFLQTGEEDLIMSRCIFYVLSAMGVVGVAGVWYFIGKRKRRKQEEQK